MCILKEAFGKTLDNREIDLFTLRNSNNAQVKITDFGGAVTSIIMPDRNGNPDDIALGFDSLEGYLKTGFFHGGVIGRYANRIADALIRINGMEYRLSKNCEKYQLHGGFKGFHKVVWNASIIAEDGLESLQLEYLSSDGEEGFPGNLSVIVIYTLTDKNELIIDYHAHSDQDTVVNLTNHTYFNLAGHSSGDILNHILMINSDKFTPADKNSIPTGEFRDVEDLPLDFRKPVPIGLGIENDYEQIAFVGGYDHNWVLNSYGVIPQKAAELYDPASGRNMEVFTTMPGIQFYSGNFLDGTEIGKGGVAYGKHSGLCLETQYYPDSPNQPGFPSPILMAGQEYNHTTIYKFSVK